MATACDLVAQPVPDGTQSISFLPTLKGDAESQETHSHLYWEFYEQGSRQAVRFGPEGQWKAIRQPMLTGPVELYNLPADLGEENDLAADHPDLVARAIALMEASHQPDPKWTVPAPKKKPAR
jgi:uncharacterized sulfatase